MQSVRFPLASLSVLLLLSACNTAVPIDNEQAPTSVDQEDDSSVDVEAPPVQAKCAAANFDTATTSVTYSNSDKGISFDIPYNPKWGYVAHPEVAYAEAQPDDTAPLGHVDFGAPVYAPNLDGRSDVCDLVHSASLTFLPPKSAVDTVRSIEGEDTAIVPNTQTRIINGLTVVQYTGVGFYKNPTMEVIGTKWNYRFAMTFGDDTPEEWTYLENIVKSIKLTK